MKSKLRFLGWEIALIFRNGGNFINSLFFFTIIIFLVPLGVGPDSELLSRIAPGIIWIAALLSVLLALDRIFLPDFEDGSLEMLCLSPLPFELIIALKMLAHWITTGLPLTIIAPFIALGLNLDLSSFPWLILSLMIGTPALSFIGTIGASLTLSLRRSSLLISLLVLPLYLPTLIFGSRVIYLSLDGGDPLLALALLFSTTLISFAVAPFLASFAVRSHWKY